MGRRRRRCFASLTSHSSRAPLRQANNDGIRLRPFTAGATRRGGDAATGLGRVVNIVIPANAGIQTWRPQRALPLDSRLRGNDMDAHALEIARVIGRRNAAASHAPAGTGLALLAGPSFHKRSWTADERTAAKIKPQHPVRVA
jgi:hypothetical protein